MAQSRSITKCNQIHKCHWWEFVINIFFHVLFLLFNDIRKWYEPISDWYRLNSSPKGTHTHTHILITLISNIVNQILLVTHAKFSRVWQSILFKPQSHPVCWSNKNQLLLVTGYFLSLKVKVKVKTISFLSEILLWFVCENVTSSNFCFEVYQKISFSEKVAFAFL